MIVLGPAGGVDGLEPTVVPTPGVCGRPGHLGALMAELGPPVAEFGAANARAVVRAAQRDTIRGQWRVGEPYADTAVYGIRIKARGTSTGGFGLGQGPADVVLRTPAEFEPSDFENAQQFPRNAVNGGDWYQVAGAPAVAAVSNAYFSHALAPISVSTLAGMPIPASTTSPQ